MADEPYADEPAADNAPQVQPTTTHLTGSNRNTTLLTVAIVLVVLVAVVAALGIGLIGGEPEASASAPVLVSPPASASPSAEESPAVSDLPSTVGAEWAVVGTVPGAAPNDVTVGGPGLVAVGAEGPVGCEVCPDLGYTGRIWTSSDGREWSDNPATGIDGGAFLSHVAAGPGGLVVFGRHPVDATTENLVLVSPNGASWTTLANHPFEAIGAAVLGVTGTPSLFVAAGSLGEPDTMGHATLWTSTNGVDWETVYQSPDEGSTYEVVELDGQWVAAGEVLVASDDPARAFMQQPVAWSSTDGRTWTQHELPVPEGAFAATATALASTHAGLIAVGFAEHEVPDPVGSVLGFAAWHSLDGSTWASAPVTDAMLENIGGGFLVYDAPERAFALGSGCLCGTGTPYRWWTTPNGLDWTQLAETAPTLHAVVPVPDGLIAVGIADGEGAFFVSE